MQSEYADRDSEYEAMRQFQADRWLVSDPDERIVSTTAMEIIEALPKLLIDESLGLTESQERECVRRAIRLVSAYLD